MNCGELAGDEGLTVMHKKEVVGCVCAACLEGVSKPRVTLCRKTPAQPFQPEQYVAAEVFR